MFSDVVGYGTITTRDEALALELLEEYRTIFRRVIPLYGGRENKTMGDGFFFEFASALDAVLCAIEVQTALYERNLVVPRNRRLLVRIGIHLGDVVLNEGDSLGEGVNVAARIEGFAEPGGICVSSQVADLLQPYDQIRVQRIGRHSLKHIRTPATLYRIILPWEKKKKTGLWTKRRRGGASQVKVDPLEHTSSVLLNWVLACTLGLFLYLCGHIYYDYQHYDLAESTRTPAAAQEKERVSLRKGWQYTIAPFEEPLDAEGRGTAFFWKILHGQFWPYADQLSRPYWLMKEFQTDAVFKHPAIVLGTIVGAHRAYLNGKYIGGANHSFTLAYYTFDPSLLRSGELNYLVIKVNPKPSISPAIVFLPQLGAYLGEFNDVYKAVTKNEYYFHVVQSIYLALALLCCLGCFLFCLSNWNEKRFMYFSIYLLLGSMCLLHNSALVTAYLDFHLQRALRLFGLSVSSMILLSSYFHMVGAKRWEVANNIVAIAWSFLLFGMLIPHSTSANTFLGMWNGVLAFTFFYTCMWVLGLFYYRVIQLFRDSQWWTQVRRLRLEVVLIWFGTLTAMLSLSSMKTKTIFMLPAAILNTSFHLGNTYPAFFALSILALGLFDYLIKHRAISYRLRMDDLFLGIAEELRRTTRSEEVIPQIQARVSEFIQAERSTVYLLEEEGGETALKAHYILGSRESKPLVSRVVRANEGILGYVLDSKVPLLIKDIASDVRFQEHLTRRKGTTTDTFKTNSCMLFPLIIGEKLVGVLTVADKKESSVFTQADFSLLHVIAKDIALVLHTRALAAAAATAGPRAVA